MTGRVLHEYLAAAALRFPDQVALVTGQRRVRYRELWSETQALANWLLSVGITPGDRVVILASNGATAVVAFWAVLSCGAVAVMVHPATKREKLLWLLADSGAAALVSEETLAPVFAPAIASSPDIKHVVVAGLPPAMLGNAVALDAAIAYGSSAPRTLPLPGPNDVAALIYTSGSTGEPKAVMLSHRNMVAATLSISSYLELTSNDVVVCVLPLSFDYGLYQMILCVSVGARLVLERSFDLPGQVLNRIAAESITVLPGVPTLFAMLARIPDLGRWDLSSIRTVTSTASALGPTQIDWLRNTFPSARVFSMYGLTECKRCTYLPPADLARKPGSVGISIPGNEIWLVDADDHVLGPNAVGELVVRGPTVMAGYWRRPAETARRLRAGPIPGERVLYTGDLCRMDDEGYLYFVRRMDDVIKSRGEKVAPAEVESALRSIPGVLQAAVVGVPDETLGEAVKAFVVLERGIALTPGALGAACRELLEPLLVPRQIAIVPELPRTANGKIEKGSLV